ncbi:MAG: DUF423 domain-containing protein [Gammaproteobacteria bacterium]|nr:MAG: DUF423 domain-containing protein [Gammaproteobacteria bacterium]
MNSAARLFLILGAANAALVVILGAFGAHGLKARLGADMMTVYQTGVQYHMFHALGLLAVALTLTQLPDSMLLKWSGWLMLAGIVIFSGSLYVLSTTGWKWLGAVTPLGGLSFIAAWVVFVVAAVKSIK